MDTTPPDMPDADVGLADSAEPSKPAKPRSIIAVFVLFIGLLTAISLGTSPPAHAAGPQGYRATTGEGCGGG